MHVRDHSTSCVSLSSLQLAHVGSTDVNGLSVSSATAQCKDARRLRSDMSNALDTHFS